MVFEYNTESSEAYSQQKGGLSAADLFASVESNQTTPKHLFNQTSDHLVISPLWSSEPKVTAVQADLQGGPAQRAASSTEAARVQPPEVPSTLQPARVQPPEVPSAVQPARVQPPEVPSRLQPARVQPPEVPSTLQPARVQPPEVPSTLQPARVQPPEVPEVRAARVQPPEVPSTLQPARVQPPEVPEVRADLRGGDLRKK